jgi:SAM-dependent methyltransferase
MKKRLLDLLVCPACREALVVEAVVVEDDEIIVGQLSCQDCRRRYPIRGGVPRFVGEGTYAESFGFEWHRFRIVQLDSANGTRESATSFKRKTGLTADDVRGSLVLDAGVGAGRYAEIVADWGGEVVGVDVTHAVDAAFENIGRRAGIHLVQADIFALPFRDETFDLGYSIGVLHHTPAPAMAFSRVANTVKKGGQLAIYVYEAAGLARHFSDVIRVLTTRLPLKIVYVAASAAVPLYYLYRFPLIGRLFRTVVPMSLHPRWRWRWLDTFDWYAPRYQWKHTYPEVLNWFWAAGFTVLHAAADAICLRGVKV